MYREVKVNACNRAASVRHVLCVFILAGLFVLLIGCKSSSTGTVTGHSVAGVVINSGAAFTSSKSVTLSFTAGSDVTALQVSEDVNFVNVQWELFSTSRQYTFVGDYSTGGTATIYAKFQSSDGAASSPMAASIYIDTDPRATLVSPPDTSVTTTTPTLAWSYAHPIPNPAYHIQVSGDALFSDANIVADVTTAANTTSVVYSGKALVNLMKYYWRVAIIDESGHTWSWSATGSFVVQDENLFIRIPFQKGGGNRPPKTSMASAASKLYAMTDHTTGSAEVFTPFFNGYNGNDAAPAWSTLATSLSVTGGTMNPCYYGLNLTSLLTALNDKIYHSWNCGGNLRVAVYNGNDSAPLFRFVDGGTVQGISRTASSSSSKQHLSVFQGRLYAVWIENGQVRAAVYNGNDAAPAWAFIDGNGPSTGINKDTAREAFAPQITVANSKLYAIWTESTAALPVLRVAAYNGNDSAPAWAYVDGSGTASINQFPASEARNPHLAEFESRLYAVWAQGVIIHSAVYNGNDSAPSWTFVDGNGTGGMNRMIGQDADDPKIVVFKSKLHATWAEKNADNDWRIRMARYNGIDTAPAWSFIDGAGELGISAGSNAGSPSVLVFNSRLYEVWVGNNGSLAEMCVWR